MAIKMVALLTFAGVEGFILRNQVFEAETELRAEELVKHDLAVRHEEQEEEPGLKTIPLEETIKALNSHAKIDEFAEMNKLVIPGKDEAKLAERQEAIKAALLSE